MSDATLYTLITAGMFLVAVFFAFALCRAAGRASRAEEAQGRVWDEGLGHWVRLPYGAKPGPGQLTESEVRARDRFQLVVGDLAADPQWAAARQRLLDDVRDHRTNTPEGD